MTVIMQDALILLVLLQVKHMFADFYLQTPRMLAARDRYMHTGRAQHAGVHAVGSAIALVIVGTPAPLVLIMVVVEWVVHYHIDWAKGWHSVATQQTPTDAGYWRAVGLDQTLHQFTYVVMIWIWACYGAG